MTCKYIERCTDHVIRALYERMCINGGVCETRWMFVHENDPPIPKKKPKEWSVEK